MNYYYSNNIYYNNPLCNASLINPFLFFNTTVCVSGSETNASAAPPNINHIC